MSLELITSGREKYKRLFKDIEQATESIHIQYYSIHNDEVGEALVARLVQKAKEGVKVRVMYDGIGSAGTTKSFFKPLIEVGGYVEKIKPFPTHYRNHRKIVVIDGKIGYMGGMNIGKQYANLAKVKNPWRDTQLRILGDNVYLLQYYFLSDWCYVNKPKVCDIDYEDLEDLFPPHTITQYLPCQLVSGGVDTYEKCIKMSYLKLITKAKERIQIQSPYFIPDTTIMEALKMAAASGVEIEIMIPSVKSNFFLQPVIHYYIDELIDYGAKCYLYKGYIHAKTLSIDTHITSIGSVNMDIRSLEVDDEICCLIYSDEFTALHQSQFEKDKENATELDYKAFKQRGVWVRLQESLYRLFAPLM